jgi:hypothetical protein
MVNLEHGKSPLNSSSLYSYLYAQTVTYFERDQDHFCRQIRVRLGLIGRLGGGVLLDWDGGVALDWFSCECPVTAEVKNTNVVANPDTNIRKKGDFII